MPKKEFVVGHIDETKDEEASFHEENHEENHVEHHGDDSHSENHHGGGLSIHFESENTIQSAKETTLTAHLQQGNSPLSEANVKFEVWKDTEEKHRYIDAVEEAKGEYQAAASFSTAGTYYVKVHVEKGELHDHQDYTINVK
jgi:hypothetical protein